MEVLTDGQIARDKLLAELWGTTDVEDGRSLWRAAKKFNLKARMERAAGCDTSRPPSRAFEGALGDARELSVEG